MGESKLEAFHDRLAHFANSGMRDSLSDNLNLAGTCRRWNLGIRHKRALLMSPDENPSTIAKVQNQRKIIPGGWERVVPFFNHSELAHANTMAVSVGCEIPFSRVEALPPDNGERFFFGVFERKKVNNKEKW